MAIVSSLLAWNTCNMYISIFRGPQKLSIETTSEPEHAEGKARIFYHVLKPFQRWHYGNKIKKDWFPWTS